MSSSHFPFRTAELQVDGSSGIASLSLCLMLLSDILYIIFSSTRLGVEQTHNNM